MASKKKFEVGFNISAALAPAFSGAMGKASGQMSKLGETIRKAETGQKGIQRFGSLIKGVEKTRLELAAAKTRARELKKEFKATAKPTKKLAGQMAAAKNEAKKLNEKLKFQKRTLSETKGGLDRAGISTRNLTAQNSRLASTIDRAKKSQDRLNKAMAAQKRAKSAMGGRGGKALKAGAATGVAAGMMAAPVLSTMDFSEGMAKVKAVSGAVGADFQALRDQAISLGESTQHSSTKAAQGMQYLAMAGFKTKQIIGAMPGVLDLTTASGEELGAVANIGSNILSAFGYEAGKMGTVGDILTKTFTSSNTTLSGLGETLKYVGPIAKNAKISLAQVAAMAGKLGDEGIEASMAGTSLRSMITNLAAPTKIAQAALDDLGIETKDSEGNLRNITDLMEEMAAATEGMGSADKIANFKNIFGAEAASAASIVIKQAGTGALREYTNEVERSAGITSKKAKIMGDNLKGGFITIGSAVEGASIAFTDIFEPSIKSGSLALAGMIRGVSGWVRENQGLVKVLAISTLAIGGIVTAGFALGTAIAAVQFAMAGLVVIGPILTGLKMGFLALNTTIWANPIGLVIAALVGGAALVYKYWEPISAFFSGLWDKIAGIIDKFSVIGKIGGFFKDLWGTNKGIAGKPSIIGGNNNSFNRENGGPGNGLAEKARRLPKPGAGVQVKQTVSPVIHIAPGVDAKGVRQAVAQGMTAANDTMKKSMEEIMADERRVAFE